MIIDARFVLLVAQLAIKFGEYIIPEVIDLCHKDKTVEEKGHYHTQIKNMVDRKIHFDPETGKITALS